MIPDIPDYDPAQPWWVWPVQVGVWVVPTVLAIVVVWWLQRGSQSKIDHVVAETSPNHGGSMKDRTEQMVETLEEIKKDIGGLRQETRGLAEADRLDRAASVDAHRQIYDQMAIDRRRVESLHSELLKAVKAADPGKH